MARHYQEAPKKKRSPAQIVYTVLLVVCAVVFAASVWVLISKMVIEPAQNEAVNNDIRDVFSQAIQDVTPVEPDVSDHTPETSEAPEETPAPAPTPTPQQRMDAVKKLNETVNSDIVGWITIGGTVVDYPVLQSSQDAPEYYLHRNYHEEYSAYGSIFLDAQHSTDGDLQILYGHSMNDGSMFARLLAFGDPSVVASSPLIQYDTQKEASQWAIVSVFKANTNPAHGPVFPYIRSGFSSDADKLQYIYDIMKRSMVNTHVSVNEDDDLLLLSTCSYEFDDFRTVVAARRLRPGEEMPEVNVTAAEHTLYPDCWYDRYGGSPYRWPETFDDAYAMGVADWYDR